MAKGFGPILLLGGVAAIFLLGKKKAGNGLIILDSSCLPTADTLVASSGEDVEAARDFALRSARVGMESAVAVGGLAVLGDPPGDLQRNTDFIQAVATEFLKRVAPECISGIGIPGDFGANTNEFGADYSEWDFGANRAALEVLLAAIIGFSMEMGMRGYQVGGADVTVAFEGMPGQTGFVFPPGSFSLG